MHVVDEKGEKMSKSKGNVIDPQDILKKFGAEAFRLWSCLEGNITKGDIRCSFERIQGTSKFLTKLWNISRFISCFPQVDENYELAALDKMVLAELNKLIKECRSAYEDMDVFVVANSIRTFTWSLFADHYLEAVKSRAYNRDGKFNEKLQRGAWYTLHACLKTIMKLLAPICPFATEAVWRELYSKQSIHTEPFMDEKPEWKSDLNKLTSQFVDFNTTIWKYKKDEGTALSQELAAKVYALKDLEVFKDDLKAMHKIRDLKFGKPTEKETAQKLNDNLFVVK